MGKMSASVPTFTTEAVADAANYTDAKYIALQGGAGTARTIVGEIEVGGQATSSAPQYLLFARDSTIGATGLTGVRTAALDPADLGKTSPTVAFSTTTTKPQRSATLSLLNLTFNAFGGLVRWVAAPGYEISMVGNTASLGELSLSGFTGTTPGLVGAHILYEQQ